MHIVLKNKNDYFYYYVKLRRCTKIETLIIRLSVLGVQNRFQLYRTFLPLCNFLAPPSVSRVNYTRIRWVGVCQEALIYARVFKVRPLPLQLGGFVVYCSIKPRASVAMCQYP